MLDVIVIGGGPAGLSAALMLGRCRRRVLLCDSGQPRNRRSRALHGYLTRDGVAPGSFNEMGRAELVKYGIEFRPIGVTAVTRVSDRFQVSFDNGRDEAARFVLIATGVTDDLPAIPGFEECYGRSVFHCPYCDGWEWRDRPLAVFGRSGSRSAPGARPQDVERGCAALLSRHADERAPCGTAWRAIESRFGPNASSDSIITTARCRRFGSRRAIRSRAKRSSLRPRSIPSRIWRFSLAAR